MNESSDTSDMTPSKMGGAFADGLTLIRFLLTPIVMFVIIKMGWPDLAPAVLATSLFIVAAVTDFLDDIIGGSKKSVHRQFGWFDDIADLVLIIGTLIALACVINEAGLMGWAFAVPVVVLIAREVIVGLVKGYEFSRYGWPSTKWLSLKNTLTFIAVCTLLASPWITAWLNSLTTADADLMAVYGSNSAGVWMFAQGMLWIAAIISVLTGIKLLRMPKNKTA
ncbi:CDP-alcohol phosphatidyltransferase family protein [Fretibacter rubidus]|uniref:CDP-alcohol phosphatidyltransferase family protein n=1 Tax=Fretibacter rubidus TaxID=570162 RepID=UPI00352BA6E8